MAKKEFVQFVLESLAWAAVFTGILFLIRPASLLNIFPICLQVAIVFGLGMTYLRTRWNAK